MYEQMYKIILGITLRHYLQKHLLKWENKGELCVYYYLKNIYIKC